MNTLIRWMKFNMVGALGMGLQLSAFTLFNRCLAGHYLFASAAAVELALLHNFAWHSTFTWRDRRDGLTRSQRFVRFHLSNGLVSIFGNLVMMRFLVHSTHLPLLVSNSLAVLCCSLVNFYLGNHWTFPVARKTTAPQTSQAPRLAFLDAADSAAGKPTIPRTTRSPHENHIGTSKMRRGLLWMSHSTYRLHLPHPKPIRRALLAAAGRGGVPR
jgi:putative flippase GtrA